MKILVLNGSPRPNGATADMVKAFARGAEEAGHTVNVVCAAQKNVKGCMACEYCHTKGNGACVQKDDMQELYPEFLSADMVVFASPIYYFTLSAQLQAVIHRTYAFGIPKNVKKTALILSSGDADVYAPAIGEYENAIVAWWGAEDMGVFTAHGSENKSEAKRRELYAFGRSL